MTRVRLVIQALLNTVTTPAHHCITTAETLFSLKLSPIALVMRATKSSFYTESCIHPPTLFDFITFNFDPTHVHWQLKASTLLELESTIKYQASALPVLASRIC